MGASSLPIKIHDNGRHLSDEMDGMDGMDETDGKWDVS